MCLFYIEVVFLFPLWSLFWLLNSSFAEVCHLGILHFLLVQFILNPQKQFKEFGQLRR